MGRTYTDGKTLTGASWSERRNQLKGKWAGYIA